MKLHSTKNFDISQMRDGMRVDACKVRMPSDTQRGAQWTAVHAEVQLVCAARAKIQTSSEAIEFLHQCTNARWCTWAANYPSGRSVKSMPIIKQVEAVGICKKPSCRLDLSSNNILLLVRGSSSSSNSWRPKQQLKTNTNG